MQENATLLDRILPDIVDETVGGLLRAARLASCRRILTEAPLCVWRPPCHRPQNRTQSKIQLLAKQNAEMATHQVRLQTSDPVDVDALIAPTVVERQYAAA